MSTNQPNLFLNRATVLLLTGIITAIFYAMIKGFVMAILLAAIFAGLLTPLYEKLARRLKGRRSLASLLTIVLFILIIFLPAAGFLAVVVDQAINAGRSVAPWVQENMSHPDSFLDRLDSISIVHQLFPDRAVLVERINTTVKTLGTFVASGLSAFTTGTVQFFFLAFILLFTMYYFLIDGKQYLRTMLYYLPLKDQEESMLLSRFTTVTRATLKGTLIIGIVQGAAAAVAMAPCGIQNTVFWGVIMAVLSIIPAVGPAIVWLPAAIILILSGDVVPGVGLLLFGVIVVGNIDNLLRPRLVGKDAQLPDLMILFGTLGGLAMFGMAGIIIGPIIAALFVTLWEIYGEAFKDSLHTVYMFQPDEKDPPAIPPKEGSGEVQEKEK